jgi:adenylate cyclase, class 2
MKEVEVKAKIDNFDSAKEKLVSLGCELSEPLIQDDKIYLQNGLDLGDTRKGLVAMRIRNQNGKSIFNMKIQLENDLDNTEHETEVADPDELHEMLLNLDYYIASHVNKKRVKCNYDGMEICLDEVRDLGTFIEAEKLTKDEDSVKIQNELFEFLKSLGVKETDRVTKGYDVLMYEKNKS